MTEKPVRVIGMTERISTAQVRGELWIDSPDFLQHQYLTIFDGRYMPGLTQSKENQSSVGLLDLIGYLRVCLPAFHKTCPPDSRQTFNYTVGSTIAASVTFSALSIFTPPAASNP